MSGITTTIQKLGPTGRVEREVEATEVPSGQERPARRATDRASSGLAPRVPILS